MAGSNPSNLQSINFRSPTTGDVQPVTSDQWDAALSAGYKPTDHTLMYDQNGQRGMVPNEEVRQHASQGYTFDVGSQQMNAAAKAGGVANPGVSSPPAARQISQQAQQYSATLDPQQRYLYNLSPNQRAQAEQKMSAGGNMNFPLAVAATFAGVRPVQAIADSGVGAGLKAIGMRFLRPAIGAGVGARAGEYVGQPIGKALGNEETGSQIGSTTGALLGAAALGNPAKLSEVPFLGRFLTSEDEFADVQAARKLAQQQATERAIANNPQAQQRAVGEFMNRGYQNVSDQPALPDPNVARQQQLGEFMNRGYRSMDSSPEALATRPSLSPTIYENEAQANQVEALKQRLKQEASDAGTYSAARGSVKRPVNYQQRIGTKLPWMP